MAWWAVLALGGAILGSGGCGGGGSGSGHDSNCTQGSVTCSCYPNNTCNVGLSCASGLCVDLGQTGTGTGQSTGTDTTASTGGGTGQSTGGGTGQSTGGGTGQSTGGGTGQSTGGSTGQSTASMTMTSSTGTGTGTGAGTGDTCGGAATTVLDNFSSCDTAICNLGGRTGSWFKYASADINQTFDVSSPPSGFGDQACAAWSTGGPITGVTVTSSYAGVGFNLLAGGSAYSLSSYMGVTVSIESGQEVEFVVEDSLGGYFGTAIPAGGSSPMSYTLSFANLTPLANSQTTTLALNSVVAIEFDANTPTSYGFAIYAISLE